MPKIKLRTLALIRCLWCFLFLASLAHGQALKLGYSYYLGGSADEYGYAIATDTNGAIYISGFTLSSDLPIISALQPYFGGGTGDLFVAKLKADSSGFDYITYIGGSGGEGDPAGYVGGIAVDAQGNAYVAGVARSSDFPTTPGAFQTSIGSQFACDSDPDAGLCGDAFVLKLNSTGDRLLYSTFLGGSDYDDAKAIAIDATGAAYVTGVTASPDFPTTAGTFQSTLRDVDAYVAKLSPDGSHLLYSTLLGGTGLDAGMALTVDQQGRAYVAGTTQAADFPLKQAPQTKFGDPWDAFVIRLNAAGSDLDFSTFLGGQGTQEAFGIVVDTNGDIYVAGFTDSADFPTRNAFQASFGGGDGNGFVTKLRGDGTAIIYSTFLGGADGRSELNAIAVDASGSVYVGGRGGLDFPIVSSLQAYAGSSDIVVSKLTPDGLALFFWTYLGGSGTDVASGIALDHFGKIAITGQTASEDFPVTGNSLSSTLKGSTDAFIVKLVQAENAGPIFSSPKLIAIGQVYVGQLSPQKSIRISNPGNQTLVVISVSSSADVHVNNNCGSLVPGASCTISAGLTADAAGDLLGFITICDNAPDSPQTIFVRGTGVYGGDLEMASLVTSANFDYYGKIAIPVIATITNHGPNDSDSVVIRVTSDSGSATCDPCYVGRIRAGNSAVARFNFLPNAYGMIPITVRVESPSPDLSTANDLRTVVAANPRYRVDLPQLTFTSQIVNVPSAAQRITFTSLDQQGLQLSFVVSPEFQATYSCSANTLRCYADVVFLPRLAGIRTGTLTITDPAAGTVQQITLQGVGVLAPHVKLSSSTLQFVTGVGASSSPTALILTNDGSAPVFIVGITIGGMFNQSNHCPASLLPAESCSILVRFLPDKPGSYAGSLTLFHSAASLFDVVSLAGTGIPLMNLERPTRPSTVRPGTAPAVAAPLSPAAPTIVRASRPTSISATIAKSTSSATPSTTPSRSAKRSPARSSMRRLNTRDR